MRKNNVATAEENTAIRRPMRARAPAQKDGPRINEEIRVREVQLIDKDGDNHGTVADRRRAGQWPRRPVSIWSRFPPTPARRSARSSITASTNTRSRRKPAEARKKQKVVEVKEIKLRPMIDDHDYDVKMRSMQRFFEEGDKVKVTLRFRGREMAHQELGTKLLNRVKDDTAQDRQGRVGAALRRPPDGDGAGAALARRASPSRSAARNSRAPLCEAGSAGPEIGVAARPRLGCKRRPPLP